MTKHKTLVATTVPANKAEVVSSALLYAAQPAAGFPAPGDDLVERPLDLNDLLIDNETATFFVRVSGESMEGLKIFDGDILVVDRSITPESRSVVVAAIHGELVVKQLVQTSRTTQLVSAHPGYQPIDIVDGEDVHVWGVVTGCVRRISKHGT